MLESLIKGRKYQSAQTDQVDQLAPPFKNNCNVSEMKVTLKINLNLPGYEKSHKLRSRTP